MNFAVLLYALIGIHFVSSTLEDDFNDFAKLIPEEKIRDIVRKYMSTDPEFQTTVAYLKSKDFADLVHQIGEKEVVQHFIQHLIDAGIDFQKLLDYLHNLFSGTDTVRGSEDGLVARGVKEFFDEVKEALPIGKLIQTFMIKMKISPDFQKFFAKISSQQTRQYVDEIRALPEVQQLHEELGELGTIIDQVIKFVYAVFGWK